MFAKWPFVAMTDGAVDCLPFCVGRLVLLGREEEAMVFDWKDRGA
jgi:hypothetical protein